jgi:hypothetical protein
VSVTIFKVYRNFSCSNRMLCEPRIGACDLTVLMRRKATMQSTSNCLNLGWASVRFPNRPPNSDFYGWFDQKLKPLGPDFLGRIRCPLRCSSVPHSVIKYRKEAMKQFIVRGVKYFKILPRYPSDFWAVTRVPVPDS